VPTIVVSAVSVWLFLYYTIGLLRFRRPFGTDKDDLSRVRKAIAKKGPVDLPSLRSSIRVDSPLWWWLEGLHNARDLDRTDLQAISVAVSNNQPRPTQLGNVFLLLSLLATIFGLIEVVRSLGEVLQTNTDVSVAQRELVKQLPRMGTAFIGTAIGIVLSILYWVIVTAITSRRDSLDAAVEQFAVLELAPLVLPKAPSRILEVFGKTLETVRSAQESAAKILKTVRSVQKHNAQMVKATLVQSRKMARSAQNRNSQMIEAARRENLKTVRAGQERSAAMVKATYKVFAKLAALTKSAVETTEAQVSAAIDKNAKLLKEADEAMKVSAGRLDEAMGNMGHYLTKSSAALGNTAREMQNLIAQNLSPTIQTLRSTSVSLLRKADESMERSATRVDEAMKVSAGRLDDAAQVSAARVDEAMGNMGDYLSDSSAALGNTAREMQNVIAQNLSPAIQTLRSTSTAIQAMLSEVSRILDGIASSTSKIADAEKGMSTAKANLEDRVAAAAEAVNRAAEQLEEAGRLVAALANQASTSFPDAKTISALAEALQSIAGQLATLPNPAEWSKALDKINDAAAKAGRDLENDPTQA
jgi:hypothetical protein